MSLSVPQMRAVILKQYPLWKKVLAMPERQVIAIYYKILRRKPNEK
jgi:hypothetical protein